MGWVFSRLEAENQLLTETAGNRSAQDDTRNADSIIGEGFQPTSTCRTLRTPRESHLLHFETLILFWYNSSAMT